MTISRLDLKVSEVVIALGTGSKDQELIGEMLVEGFPRPIIERIMRDARIMLKEMEAEQEESQSVIRIQKMITESLDTSKV